MTKVGMRKAGGKRRRKKGIRNREYVVYIIYIVG